MSEPDGKEFLLQRNGLEDQLFACDGPITSAGPGAKPVPKSEQPRMQSEKVATESFCLRGFRHLEHAQHIAFEVCPAELARSRLILQVSGTPVAAKDSRERGAQ